MATAGGQIEVGALSEGIYTAMTTTVVGLVVGIIAYVGYNHLVKQIKSYIKWKPMLLTFRFMTPHYEFKRIKLVLNSMSSMTDIVLLLIFFMLTSMVTTNALDLVLPKQKERQTVIKISLSINKKLNFY
jgi:ABC-type lipoprotein release transport system permease subunit